MPAEVRRFGQLIRVRPDSIEAYERLHAEPWPAVSAAIRRANIRNYSIFRHDGLLFGYLEYVGADYPGDMARLAADPEVQALVEAHRCDAGALPGAGRGLVVARPGRDLPSRVIRAGI